MFSQYIHSARTLLLWERINFGSRWSLNLVLVLHILFWQPLNQIVPHLLDSSEERGSYFTPNSSKTGTFLEKKATCWSKYFFSEVGTILQSVCLYFCFASNKFFPFCKNLHFRNCHIFGSTGRKNNYFVREENTVSSVYSFCNNITFVKTYELFDADPKQIHIEENILAQFLIAAA